MSLENSNCREINITPRLRSMFILLSLLASAGLLIVTAPHGIGVSSDSVGYISTARNIAIGNGVTWFHGGPLLVWPPLYPAVLAVPGFFLGVDAVVVARFTNAILFAGLVYLSGLAGLYSLPAPYQTIGALFCITTTALSTCIVQVCLSAWSEALFIFFVLLCLLNLRRYIMNGARNAFLVMSLAASLAALTRYIGVVLVPTVAICLWFQRRDSARIRVGQLLQFTLISLVPLAGWLLRNYAVSGTLMGPRGASIYTLRETLGRAYRVVSFWYLPDRPETVYIAVLAGVTLVAYCLYVFLRRHHSPISAEMGLLLPWAVFLLLYVLVLCTSSARVAYGLINSRLMSPAFVPLTVIGSAVISKFSVSVIKLLRVRWAGILAAVAIIAAGSAGPARLTLPTVRAAMTQGIGYSSVRWGQSETVQYIRHWVTPGPESTVYSNAPDVAYLLADLAAVEVPAQTLYNSSHVVGDLEALRGSWPSTSAYIVWFDGVLREYQFTIDQLSDISNVHLLIRLSDGAVYSVSPQ